MDQELISICNDFKITIGSIEKNTKVVQERAASEVTLKSLKDDEKNIDEISEKIENLPDDSKTMFNTERIDKIKEVSFF